LADGQADRLRRLKQEERRRGNGRKSGWSVGAHRLSVTSGKGGVGKSNYALNTAIVLAGFGQKVLLIDADTNLANLDILLGVRPRYNLSDVFAGDRLMQDVIIQGPGGIDILPGSSGVLEMLELDDQVQRRLLESFAELEKEHDYLIIDTGAGLTQSIVSYVTSSHEVVMVTNPEPTAITDAYSMIKVATHRNPTLRVRLLVNMVSSIEEAAEVFDKLNLVVQNFLNIPIEFLGHLPTDACVAKSVMLQAPFVLKFPRCAAAVAIRMMARKLLQKRPHPPDEEDQTLLERIVRGNPE